jgi:hypothetical protein
MMTHQGVNAGQIEQKQGAIRGRREEQNINNRLLSALR